MLLTKTIDKEIFYKKALLLSIITILYNIIEGIVSVYFGIDDDTLALMGFGLDSFVEVLSGIGILHMIMRMKSGDTSQHDRFEKTALRITGSAFYLLSIGLIITVVYNIKINHKPETTYWGIIISIVSIVSMYILIKYKLKVAKEYGSKALEADAQCTKTCLYLSFVLLLSSLGFELTGLSGLDSFGALGIAWFAFKEGKEAFHKARGNLCSCQCSCGN
ncbi:MAG: cation transporter [Thermodesulfovibrionales bacterium]|nr:cation transporter [Thermodesulfovibrionales bacterium]